MRTLLILIILLSATACTTSSPLQMSPLEVQEKVTVNELDIINKTLVISLQDGQRRTVKVKAVTENSIIGKNAEYLFADIIAIETKDLDLLETTGLAVSGVGIALVTLVAAVTISFAF